MNLEEEIKGMKKDTSKNLREENRKLTKRIEDLNN